MVKPRGRGEAPSKKAHDGAKCWANSEGGLSLELWSPQEHAQSKAPERLRVVEDFESAPEEGSWMKGLNQGPDLYLG